MDLMAVMWAKVAGDLHHNRKIRRAGRSGREVFIWAVCQVALHNRDGWVPLADVRDSVYLADELMCPVSEAESGVRAAFAAGLIREEGDRAVIVGWDDDWSRKSLSGAERVARHRERNGERNGGVTETLRRNGDVTEALAVTQVTRSEEIREEEIRSEERENQSPEHARAHDPSVEEYRVTPEAENADITGIFAGLETPAQAPTPVNLNSPARHGPEVVPVGNPEGSVPPPLLREAKRKELIALIPALHREVYNRVNDVLGRPGRPMGAFSPADEAFLELLNRTAALDELEADCRHVLAVLEAEALEKRTVEWLGARAWSKNVFAGALAKSIRRPEPTPQPARSAPVVNHAPMAFSGMREPLKRDPPRDRAVQADNARVAREALARAFSPPEADAPAKPPLAPKPPVKPPPKRSGASEPTPLSEALAGLGDLRARGKA